MSTPCALAQQWCASFRCKRGALGLLNFALLFVERNPFDCIFSTHVVAFSKKLLRTTDLHVVAPNLQFRYPVVGFLPHLLMISTHSQRKHELVALPQNKRLLVAPNERSFAQRNFTFSTPNARNFATRPLVLQARPMQKFICKHKSVLCQTCNNAKISLDFLLQKRDGTQICHPVVRFYKMSQKPTMHLVKTSKSVSLKNSSKGGAT